MEVTQRSVRELKIENWLKRKLDEFDRDVKCGHRTVTLSVLGAWPELLASLDALIDSRGWTTEWMVPGEAQTLSKPYIICRKKPAIEEDSDVEVQGDSDREANSGVLAGG